MAPEPNLYFFNVFFFRDNWIGPMIVLILLNIMIMITLGLNKSLMEKSFSNFYKIWNLIVHASSHFWLYLIETKTIWSYHNNTRIKHISSTNINVIFNTFIENRPYLSNASKKLKCPMIILSSEYKWYFFVYFHFSFESSIQSYILFIYYFCSLHFLVFIYI